MTESTTTNPRYIARQLALGYVGVSLVSLLMCAALLLVIRDVSGLIAGMRQSEATVQGGLELSAAMRELNIHIAHSLIEGDESHLAHYREWRAVVHERLDQLERELPPSGRASVTKLRAEEQQLHETFVSSALPAAESGDTMGYRLAHRKLERLGRDLAKGADELATASNSRMAHSHVRATTATNIGLFAGGACALIVVALSIVFTVRLRREVLGPLVDLTSAADHVARGDFDVRVGSAGKGELGVLSRALDRMASELKQREVRLIHQERMAVLGQIAAGVAHELNNPIGIIRGYLKTMLDEAEDTALREELEILDEEARQCQRIAEDLLSYARAPTPAKRRIDVPTFIAGVTERFRDRVGEREIALQVQPGVVCGDPDRLRQVVFNLLQNAVDCSAEGTQIHVRGRPSDGGYVVEVEDEGSGVAPADKLRIFEPFFSNRPGGTGLGLAVCAGIVRAHGGSIEVLSGEAGGALFRLSLPRTVTAQTQQGADA